MDISWTNWRINRRMRVFPRNVNHIPFQPKGPRITADILLSLNSSSSIIKTKIFLGKKAGLSFARHCHIFVNIWSRQIWKKFLRKTCWPKIKTRQWCQLNRWWEKDLLKVDSSNEEQKSLVKVWVRNELPTEAPIHTLLTSAQAMFSNRTSLECSFMTNLSSKSATITLTSQLFLLCHSNPYFKKQAT